MNLFTPPPKTKYTVLNLGAGVQSSCLALMAAKGEITPMPDFAVFADTQAEPQSVYDWLDWLEKQLPYPVYRVTGGDLTKNSLNPVSRKREGINGEKIGDMYMHRLIPVFGIMPNGDKTAAIGRKCTSNYKIRPIIKKIKELCHITRGQKEVTVTQWIGISWDELQRAKPASDKWSQHYWPLLDRKMKRHDCINWMRDNGYPEPPRSACVYCPFHSDTEWKRLRDDEPFEFSRAIKFDTEIRKQFKEKDQTMKMEIYLHNSCKPLSEVDFDSDEDKGQQVWDFKSECEGMCGV
jgi:3'-phosphoadenosine 5'-phosphosulfate sulfotransferase (PAPS reductase)/FAD synthetase